MRSPGHKWEARVEVGSATRVAPFLMLATGVGSCAEDSSIPVNSFVAPLQLRPLSWGVLLLGGLAPPLFASVSAYENET